MDDSRSQPAAEERRKPRVILWGPFPDRIGIFGGGIGGYARCNSQMLRSFLGREVDLAPVRMTSPNSRHRALSALDLVARMCIDVLRIGAAVALRRPDVLHITALYWRSIYREAFGTWIARLFGVAVFYDIRAGTFEEFGRRATRLERACLAWIMRNADEIGVEGKRYEAFVRERFGRKGRWFPNFFLSADLERFDPAPLERSGCGEPLRLVYVGYVRATKGVDVLLEAAHRLSARVPVRVTLIGAVDPDFRATLESYRERRDASFEVVSTGRLDLDALLAVLQEQHLFVFLSRFFGEGHTNAVNEAMAMGLPVVASRHGFLPDVVGESCGALVDDALDADEVAAVLGRLQADWPALRQLGRNARRRIEREFASRTVLRTPYEIYRRYQRDGWNGDVAAERSSTAWD